MRENSPPRGGLPRNRAQGMLGPQLAFLHDEVFALQAPASFCLRAPGYNCLIGRQPQTLISHQPPTPFFVRVFWPCTVPSGYFLYSSVMSTDLKALGYLPQDSACVYGCFAECSQISSQLPDRIPVSSPRFCIFSCCP